MAPVDPACLKPFNNIGAVLLPAVLRRILQRRVLHPVRKIRLEPVASLGAHPQVTPCFAVNPAAEINPVHDFAAAFAVPWHIFTQMAVGFRAVVAEPAQHINPHLLCPAEFRMTLERFQQACRQILALMLGRDIPGLMVNPGTDDVHFGFLQPVDFSDLVMSVLYTMA
ncbi:hypothetical protein D3C80_1592250 [compost metagenome]